MYLLRVVDLPDDGLPTSPMRGSRGILAGQVIPWRKCRRRNAGETGPEPLEIRISNSAGLKKVVPSKRKYGCTN
jgi:hypothetical protein